MNKVQLHLEIYNALNDPVLLRYLKLDIEKGEGFEKAIQSWIEGQTHRLIQVVSDHMKNVEK